MTEHKRLTPQELETLLASEKKIVRITDRIIPFECWLDLENRKFGECYFSDCIFENGVHVRMNGKVKCTFIDTKVEFSLQVHEPKSKTTDVFPTLLVFKSQLERLLVQDNAFDVLYVFECAIDDLVIKNVSVHGKYLTIAVSEIKQTSEISNTQIDKQFLFDSMKIIDDCTIQNVTAPALEVTKTDFGGDLNILNSSLNIEIDRTTCSGMTLLSDCNLSRLRLDGCLFHKVFALEYTAEWQPASTIDTVSRKNWLIDYVGVVSSSFLGGFDAGLDWEDEQLLPVKRLEFVCTASTKGDTFLHQLDIRTCTFRGMNRDASFHLVDSTIAESLMFFEFVNQGKMVMNGVRFSPEVHLHFNRTVLGPAHFTAIDFSHINTGFHFYDSDISLVTHTSVNWPMNLGPYRKRPSVFSAQYWSEHFYPHWLKLHWHNKEKTDDEAVYYFNVREFYRQLKSAAEKVHDKVLALEFQAVEMKAYERVLRLTRSSLSLERIILFLGRTNQYGQNWWRPVYLAFIATALFYIPVAIGVDPELSFLSYTKTEFSDFLTQLISHHDIFPQLLNPVHSLEKLSDNPDAIHPFTWWLDYLHRIIMAYFIYQTISAFRKYVK